MARVLSIGQRTKKDRPATCQAANKNEGEATARR
jgi:hypothetical protein